MKFIRIGGRFYLSVNAIKNDFLSDLYRSSKKRHVLLRKLRYFPELMLIPLQREVSLSHINPKVISRSPDIIIQNSDNLKTQVFIFRNEGVLLKLGGCEVSRYKIVREKLAIRKARKYVGGYIKTFELGHKNKILAPYYRLCAFSDLHSKDIIPFLQLLKKIPLEQNQNVSAGGVYCHGDLAIWNVSRLKDELFAFDWEDFGIDRPGVDLFYFLVTLYFIESYYADPDDFISEFQSLFKYLYPETKLDDDSYQYFIQWLQGRSPIVYAWFKKARLHQYQFSI